MPRKPLVTVLMSVHNGLPFLPEAVDSVLAQTLRDFEFLIVEDGSTDGSTRYLAGLRDPRVRLLHNRQNLGLAASLNRGLNEAAGTFLARIDADDVSVPDRLARQVEFLRARPAVGVVGSSRVLIDERGVPVGTAPAAEDDLRLRWKCLLGNPFAHPTVMLRLDVLDTHRLRYDPFFRTAQDYDLWSRLLAVSRGANLREPLLRYRLRGDAVSRVHKAEQLQNHDRIAGGAIRRLVPGFEISPAEVTQLRGRFGGRSVREADMDPSERRWVDRYLRLLDAFVVAHAGEPGATAFHAEQRAAIEAPTWPRVKPAA